MAFFKSRKKVVDKESNDNLSKGLEKTKKNFFSTFTKQIVGKSKIDASVLDNLEEVLVGADVGVETTLKIIERIENRVAKDKYVGSDELNSILKEEITGLLVDEKPNSNINKEGVDGPFVILVVGVNGVGKTTTIGKLANKYKREGKKVILGAADTFRAAAIDQLTIWAERVNVPIIKQKMGSDPASVVYDTMNSAVAQKSDVVIIDTAGRLHNKVNLMNELTKIKNVIKKILPETNYEVMLVLDGSTGQNAFVQAQEFVKATEVDSLAITKVDGSAKGGVILGISDQFKIPVKYLGVGEGIDDLNEFDKITFVETFFN